MFCYLNLMDMFCYSSMPASPLGSERSAHWSRLQPNKDSSVCLLFAGKTNNQLLGNSGFECFGHVFAPLWIDQLNCKKSVQWTQNIEATVHFPTGLQSGHFQHVFFSFGRPGLAGRIQGIQTARAQLAFGATAPHVDLELETLFFRVKLDHFGSPKMMIHSGWMWLILFWIISKLAKICSWSLIRISLIDFDGRFLILLGPSFLRWRCLSTTGQDNDMFHAHLDVHHLRESLWRLVFRETCDQIPNKTNKTGTKP